MSARKQAKEADKRLFRSRKTRASLERPPVAMAAEQAHWSSRAIFAGKDIELKNPARRTGRGVEKSESRNQTILILRRLSRNPTGPFARGPQMAFTPALTAAIALAKRGIFTFPMTIRKTPLRGSHGVRDATCDPDALRRLFSDPHAELCAIATGRPSGIIVLDVERSGSIWVENNSWRLPPSLVWQSRSGGQHWAFRHPAPLRTVPLCRIHHGVELRADRASAIFWPGAGFPFLNRCKPAALPDWLAAFGAPSLMPPRLGPPDGTPAHAAGYAAAALRRAADRVRSARPGTRNTSLNREAFTLSRFARSGDLTAIHIARELACAAHLAGLEPGEIRATITSALRAGGVA